MSENKQLFRVISQYNDCKMDKKEKNEQKTYRITTEWLWIKEQNLLDICNLNSYTGIENKNVNG